VLRVEFAEVVGMLIRSSGLLRAASWLVLGITMASGKTHIAVAESYRLLRFAEAQRILYLVDRVEVSERPPWLLAG
jgi:hypothetical protein